MYQNYKKNICSICKNCNSDDCHITLFREKNVTYIKCINYQKDENKVKGYTKPLQRTAKIGKLIMPGLISDWSRV